MSSGVFMSFYMECFSQTSFVPVYTSSSDQGEILGEDWVQQGLKCGRLHSIILCCGSLIVQIISIMIIRSS